MGPSVTYAISRALDRTRRVLFEPFDIGKWFVLGFCAWLAFLGKGGGAGFNYNAPSRAFGPRGSGPSGGSGGADFESFLHTAKEWIAGHVILVIAGALAAFVLLLALNLLVSWLRARGKFMFLDGVARNRAAVVEPWHQFQPRGNSVFWFAVIVGLVSFFSFLLLLGLGVLVAWSDIQAWQFGGAAITAIILTGLLFIPLAIFFALISQVLDDFIVPIMYLRNVRALDAWLIFRWEVLPGCFWNFVLFYLMKIVIAIVLVVIAVVVTCLTCCIAALPYLGTVILLPIFVFHRCYSLFFLAQLGEQWHVFTDEPVMVPFPRFSPPPPPPPPTDGGGDSGQAMP